MAKSSEVDPPAGRGRVCQNDAIASSRRSLRMNGTIARTAGLAAALLPPLAQASFNSWGNQPWCTTTSCLVWMSALVGIVGIPGCLGVLFVLLLVFRRPGIPGRVQAWWVVVNGVASYVIIAWIAAAGPPKANPVPLYVFAVYAVLAVLWLRWRSSKPGGREPVEPEKAGS